MIIKCKKDTGKSMFTMNELTSIVSSIKDKRKNISSRFKDNGAKLVFYATCKCLQVVNTFYKRSYDESLVVTISTSGDIRIDDIPVRLSLTSMNVDEDVIKVHAGWVGFSTILGILSKVDRLHFMDNVTIREINQLWARTLNTSSVINVEENHDIKFDSFLYYKSYFDQNEKVKVEVQNHLDSIASGTSHGDDVPVQSVIYLLSAHDINVSKLIKEMDINVFTKLDTRFISLKDFNRILKNQYIENIDRVLVRHILGRRAFLRISKDTHPSSLEVSRAISSHLSTVRELSLREKIKTVRDFQRMSGISKSNLLTLVDSSTFNDEDIEKVFRTVGFNIPMMVFLMFPYDEIIEYLKFKDDKLILSEYEEYIQDTYSKEELCNMSKSEIENILLPGIIDHQFGSVFNFIKTVYPDTDITELKHKDDVSDEDLLSIMKDMDKTNLFEMLKKMKKETR